MNKHLSAHLGLAALLLALGSAQAQVADRASSAQAQVPEHDSTAPAVAAKQASELAKGDPPRWYVKDVGEAAHLRTSRKEMGAALQEAKRACAQGPASARPACLKEARATYASDMADLQAHSAPEAAPR